MGRPHRIEVPGGGYHLISRGSNREPIYWTDDDRWLFLRLVGIVSVKYAWTVLAYCLMTNHYHLVIQIADGGLSDGMQWLNGTHSRITNGRNGRSAHLFRNRFRSHLAESDAHLLRACRYVVLNPVRAGLCAHPDEWQWSSYRATAGLDPRPGFLADGELLRRFASSTNEARRLYADFVAEGIGELDAKPDGPDRHTIDAVSDTASKR
jgi:putative transposase